MISKWYTDTILLQRKTIAQDAGGAPTNNYEDVGTYKVKVQQQIGQERFINEKKEPIDTYIIFCDPSVPFLNRDRVIFGTKILDVQGITEFPTSILSNKHIEISTIYYGEYESPVTPGNYLGLTSSTIQTPYLQADAWTTKQNIPDNFNLLFLDENFIVTAETFSTYAIFITDETGTFDDGLQILLRQNGTGEIQVAQVVQDTFSFTGGANGVKIETKIINRLSIEVYVNDELKSTVAIPALNYKLFRYLFGYRTTPSEVKIGGSIIESGIITPSTIGQDLTEIEWLDYVLAPNVANLEITTLPD